MLYFQIMISEHTVQKMIEDVHLKWKEQLDEYREKLLKQVLDNLETRNELDHVWERFESFEESFNDVYWRLHKAKEEINRLKGELIEFKIESLRVKFESLSI